MPILRTGGLEKMNKLLGNRELSEKDLIMMNEIKLKGEELEDLIVKLKLMNNINNKWIEVGEIDIEKGIMCLVRAVGCCNYKV